MRIVFQQLRYYAMLDTEAKSMTDQLPEHLKRMELSWNDRSCIMLTDNSTVFRYIVAEYAEQIRTLFKSGLIDRLVEKGLLQPGTLRETGITEYPLVIEHPVIHRISYPFEWPALALKEATGQREIKTAFPLLNLTSASCCGKVLQNSLVWLRPGGGLAQGREAELVGKKLKRFIPAGECILFQDLSKA